MLSTCASLARARTAPISFSNASSARFAPMSTSMAAGSKVGILLFLGRAAGAGVWDASAVSKRRLVCESAAAARGCGDRGTGLPTLGVSELATRRARREAFLLGLSQLRRSISRRQRLWPQPARGTWSARRDGVCRVRRSAACFRPLPPTCKRVTGRARGRHRRVRRELLHRRAPTGNKPRPPSRGQRGGSASRPAAGRPAVRGRRQRQGHAWHAPVGAKAACAPAAKTRGAGGASCTRRGRSRARQTRTRTPTWEEHQAGGGGGLTLDVVGGDDAAAGPPSGRGAGRDGDDDFAFALHLHYMYASPGPAAQPHTEGARHALLGAVSSGEQDHTVSVCSSPSQVAWMSTRLLPHGMVATRLSPDCHTWNSGSGCSASCSTTNLNSNVVPSATSCSRNQPWCTSCSVECSIGTACVTSQAPSSCADPTTKTRWPISTSWSRRKRTVHMPCTVLRWPETCKLKFEDQKSCNSVGRQRSDL
eukprot:scaffold1535_cov382-Prasinococcus_capsulatus_cf.AAC.49